MKYGTIKSPGERSLSSVSPLGGGTSPATVGSGRTSPGTIDRSNLLLPSLEPVREKNDENEEGHNNRSCSGRGHSNGALFRFVIKAMNNSFLCFGPAFLCCLVVMISVGIFDACHGGLSFRSTFETRHSDNDGVAAANSIPSEELNIVVTEKQLSRWEDFKDLMVEYHLLQQQHHQQQQEKGIDLIDIVSAHNLEGAVWIHEQRDKVARWWKDTLQRRGTQSLESFRGRNNKIGGGDIPFLSLSPPSATKLLYLNNSLAYSLLIDEDNKFDYGYSGDYYLLEGGLDAQINQAYCGVATSVAVINSLRGPLLSSSLLPMDPIYHPYHYATQTDVFNDCTNQHVIRHNQTFDGIFNPPGGLSLEQVNTLLECQFTSTPAVNTSNGVIQTTVHHVDPATVPVEEMKRDMVEALKNPLSRVLINYNRKKVGQAGGGHFSPIGAYSPERDSFLIMDVAKYKYPPVWVSSARLYQSLATIDICGTWNYPEGQDLLRKDQLRGGDGWREAFLETMRSLDCQPTYRGYIVVSLLEEK